MVSILLFFYIHVNYLFLPRQHLQNTKEFSNENEAKRAN